MGKKVLSFIFLLSIFFSKTCICFGGNVLNGRNLFPIKEGLKIKAEEITDGESKAKEIPLGFCTAKVVQEDGVIKVSGSSLDGKKWEVVLAAADAYDGGVLYAYYGDFDQNGLTDIAFRYSNPSYGGATSSGDAYLLFILFDKQGWPHPEEFFSHMPLHGPPFANILRDSKGRAVLVNKRLARNSGTLDDSHTMSCYAAFYRSFNAKWTKIPIKDLSIQNPTRYSDFKMNMKNKKFEDPDLALEMCSGAEEGDAPDFGSFQIAQFKKIKSFKMDENNAWPKFQIIAEDEKGNDQEINIAEYESCYVVIEEVDGVKIINFLSDNIERDFSEMVKEGYPVKVVKVKNAEDYFIYFVKGVGRTF